MWCGAACNVVGHLRAGQQRRLRRRRDRAVHPEHARQLPRRRRRGRGGRAGGRGAHVGEGRAAHDRKRQRQTAKVCRDRDGHRVAARQRQLCLVPERFHVHARSIPARSTRSAGPTPIGRAGSRNPILMVDAVGRDNAKAFFSNVGGDVSAPGVEHRGAPCRAAPIASFNGTSMAAPHVAALAGWLLAEDPSMSVGQVREIITAGARGDVTGRARPSGSMRIRRYCSLPGAAKDLADWNDPSLDGNRRVIRSRAGVETPDAVEGPSTADGPTYSAPDGNVDIRDFRRFRDDVGGIVSARRGRRRMPTAGSIVLDGSPNDVKKDLNNDQCTQTTTRHLRRTRRSWSRFDLNGDGQLAPNAVRRCRSASGGTDVSTVRHADVRGSVPRGSAGRRRLAEDRPGQSLLSIWRSRDPRRSDVPHRCAKVDVEVKFGCGSIAAPARTIDERARHHRDNARVRRDGTSTSQGGRSRDGRRQTARLDSRDRRLQLPKEQSRRSLRPDASRYRPTHGSAFADGKSKTPVHATLVSCEDHPIPLDAEHVRFDVQPRSRREPGRRRRCQPTTADTDKNGKASVDLNVPVRPRTT